ncbi:MAG: SDR family oxidoreductase [Polyangiaceae bacterium]|nr:SDR family oxidoreductase [Polyangiaceae bacterium]
MESTNHVLKGKVAVVTGAASGIGYGIADELVRQGAFVYVVDLRKTQVDEAAAAIGPNALGFVADVTKLSDMDALYAEVKSRHGRLDAVIANAGIGDHGPLGTITEEQFDRTFGVNVKGVLFTVQPALPLMTRGGSVVIIGSTASEVPPPGMSIYGASKAAVRNLVRSWVFDVKGSGIRMNVLSPGTVDTPSLRTALTKALGAERAAVAVGAIAERSPSGRIGTPREIGSVTAFLCSDAASYVNGVELFADGGLIAAV